MSASLEHSRTGRATHRRPGSCLFQGRASSRPCPGVFQVSKSLRPRSSEGGHGDTGVASHQHLLWARTATTSFPCRGTETEVTTLPQGRYPTAPRGLWNLWAKAHSFIHLFMPGILNGHLCVPGPVLGS